MAFLKLLFIFAISFSAQAEVLEFAIIGDAGNRNANLLAIKESILGTPVRRLILPGDNLYAGTYNAVWDHWHRAEPSRAFEFSVVAIGNHTEGYDKEMSYFSSVNPRLFPNKKDYYAVPYGESVVFFVLNSDNRRNVSEQMNWLDTQLKQSTQKFIFIVAHHPTYTLTDHHDWTEVRELNENLRRILKTYARKITALLVGHDHAASAFRFGSIPVILSGATQETRPIGSIKRSYLDRSDGTPVQLVWALSERYPYWARLTIDTENPAESYFQFVSALTSAQQESRKRKTPLEEPFFSLSSLQVLTKKEGIKTRIPAETK